MLLCYFFKEVDQVSERKILQLTPNPDPPTFEAMKSEVSQEALTDVNTATKTLDNTSYAKTNVQSKKS